MPLPLGYLYPFITYVNNFTFTMFIWLQIKTFSDGSKANTPKVSYFWIHLPVPLIWFSPLASSPWFSFLLLFYFFNGCIFTFVGQFYFWIIQSCNMPGGFITGSKNAAQMHALVSVCENSIINNVKKISSINATATFAKV